MSARLFLHDLSCFFLFACIGGLRSKLVAVFSLHHSQFFFLFGSVFFFLSIGPFLPLDLTLCSRRFFFFLGRCSSENDPGLLLEGCLSMVRMVSLLVKNSKFFFFLRCFVAVSPASALKGDLSWFVHSRCQGVGLENCLPFVVCIGCVSVWFSRSLRKHFARWCIAGVSSFSFSGSLICWEAPSGFLPENGSCKRCGSVGRSSGA